MGFFDSLKKVIRGGKEKADEAKIAASKAEAKVDETVERAKRAAEKAENAVDDASDASDELKKD